MKKREKEDKGGEEGSTKKQKSADDLGRELLKAAKEGDVESVKELLQCEGVDARYHEEVWEGAPETALVVACEMQNMEVARLLLEHGGEAKQELEAAFCWAALGGHVEVVKMLMERGADPSARENRAVRWAAQSVWAIKVVKLLLQGKRVNPELHLLSHEGPFSLIVNDVPCGWSYSRVGPTPMCVSPFCSDSLFCKKGVL
jgi:hypothetical protein